MLSGWLLGSGAVALVVSFSICLVRQRREARGAQARAQHWFEQSGKHEADATRLKALAATQARALQHWITLARDAQSQIEASEQLEARMWEAVKPEVEDLCRSRRAKYAEGGFSFLTVEELIAPKVSE